MTFFIGGGRPNFTRERYMVRDELGVTMVSKKYITDNPDLFEYIGPVQVNSVIYHTYQFLG